MQRLEHLAVIKTFAEGELLSRLPLRRAGAEPVQELVAAPPPPLEAALGRLPQGRSAPRAGAIPTRRALWARASAKWCSRSLCSYSGGKVCRIPRRRNCERALGSNSRALLRRGRQAVSASGTLISSERGETPLLIGLLVALVLALGTRLGTPLQARGDQAPKAT